VSPIPPNPSAFHTHGIARLTLRGKKVSGKEHSLPLSRFVPVLRKPYMKDYGHDDVLRGRIQQRRKQKNEKIAMDLDLGTEKWLDIFIANSG
jgi:hypothetical protein